jgi:hypothetical protein
MQQLKYGILKASASSDMLMLLDIKCIFCLANFWRQHVIMNHWVLLANSYGSVVKKAHCRMQFETIIHKVFYIVSQFTDIDY